MGILFHLSPWISQNVVIFHARCVFCMPLFCDQMIWFQVGTAVGSVDTKSYTSYTYTCSV